MTEVMQQFQVLEPSTLAEAIDALHANPGAVPLSAGTDLIVRMRKGLSETDTLVDLGRIPEFQEITIDEKGKHIGAGATLATLQAHPALVDYSAVLRAIEGVAGPSHREVATLGGNLCQDTRCVYYNQSHWWRKANGYCLKYRGDICHVAPKGNRCRAAFSGDIAPAPQEFQQLLELAFIKRTARRIWFCNLSKSASRYTCRLQQPVRITTKSEFVVRSTIHWQVLLSLAQKRLKVCILRWL